MTIDQQLKEQLTQTVNVKTMTTRDQHGQPTYSAATATLARVAFKTGLSRQADGTFIATTHEIVTVGEINPTDSIWLPGDSAATTSLGKKPVEIIGAIGEFGSADYWVTKV